MIFFTNERSSLGNSFKIYGFHPIRDLSERIKELIRRNRPGLVFSLRRGKGSNRRENRMKIYTICRILARKKNIFR